MGRARRGWYVVVLGIVAGIVAGILAGIVAALAVATPGTAAEHSPKKAVLTGIPDRTVDGVEGAGAVELRTNVNGTRKLLTAPEPKPGSRFGSAIHETTTNVWVEDADGIDIESRKLTLIGAPGLTVDGKPNAGGIHVYERDGDRTRYVDLITQDDAGIPGDPQAEAEFGSSLDSTSKENDEAPGDFQTFVHGGVPGLNVGAKRAAGGVQEIAVIAEGTNGGYRFGDGKLHTMVTADVGVEPSSGDRLGTTLHTAEWGFFAGAPMATVARKPAAGFVLGFHTDGDLSELVFPGARGLPGRPQADERFGSALDMTTERLPASEGYYRELLAVGAPGRKVVLSGAGKVYVLRNDDTTSNVWRFHHGFSQDSPDNGVGRPVGGVAEEDDRFGTAVRFVTDVSRHGLPLLFVGVPGEDIEGKGDAGIVNGLFGASGATERQVLGTYGSNHRFGKTLSTNAVSGELADYLIGIPGTKNGTGSVAHAFGDTGWDPRWELFSGNGQPGDGYGSVLHD